MVLMIVRVVVVAEVEVPVSEIIPVRRVVEDKVVEVEIVEVEGVVVGVDVVEMWRLVVVVVAVE